MTRGRPASEGGELPRRDRRLLTLYGISPEIVVAKLGEMARERGVNPLRKLKRSVPRFASYVAEAVGWGIDDERPDS